MNFFSRCGFNLCRCTTPGPRSLTSAYSHWWPILVNYQIVVPFISHWIIFTAKDKFLLQFILYGAIFSFFCYRGVHSCPDYISCTWALVCSVSQSSRCSSSSPPSPRAVDSQYVLVFLLLLYINISIVMSYSSTHTNIIFILFEPFVFFLHFFVCACVFTFELRFYSFYFLLLSIIVIIFFLCDDLCLNALPNVQLTCPGTLRSVLTAYV